MSREQPSRRDATLQLPLAVRCLLLAASHRVAFVVNTFLAFCLLIPLGVVQDAATSAATIKTQAQAACHCWRRSLLLCFPLSAFRFPFSVFAFYLCLYWPCPIVCCSPFAISCSCSSVFPAAFAAAFAAAFYDDFVACYATWAHAKFQNYISLLKFN